MSSYHTPVLLETAIKQLHIVKGSWYVDCNLGGGGHTEAILKAGGKVIGIDLDPAAIEFVANSNQLSVISENGKLMAKSDNLILYQANFVDIDQVLADLNIKEVAGVLYDLGLSSYQLETADRGFSFNNLGILDMRMNPNIGVSAKDLVNVLHEGELAELFTKFGEEPLAKPIAREIVKQRKNKLIETTEDLAKIVLSVKRRRPQDKIHPATQVFQALRIVVNDELNSLKDSLPKAFAALRPHGRLAVIAFHSLEDRIVKNYFKELVAQNLANQISDKPIEASEQEIYVNPRSRSAKLRVLEKI